METNCSAHAFPIMKGMVDNVSSHCECKEHFKKFVPGLGCSMTDVCVTNNPCHKYAKCTLVAPGQTLCTCQKGYIGDGFICYGNIMDQIRDIDAKPGGQWQGKLISAIELFESSYEWPLTSLGPFTVLVPTNKGFKGIKIKDLLSNKEHAQYFVKLHIFPGLLELNGLNNSSVVYTLNGKPADILNDEKDNLLRIRIRDGKKKGKILQGDIVAANGIVHIIDKALDNMEATFASDKERSIMALLQDKARYSKFRTMVENTVVGPILDIHPGPNTVFIPANDAFKNLRDGTLDYLLSSKGSRKLRELVQYHVVSHTQGQILANGVPIEETDITAKNGRIYTLSDILIPPSIIPILPQRCDEEKTEIRMASTGSKCIYHDQSHLRFGCAEYCNVTKKCVDGMKGNGTCICNTGFEGSHCQFCSDPNKYGPHCDQKCKCVYGKCDNQIESDGICLAGSCKSGYAGKFCDTQAVCQLTSSGIWECVCAKGYEGDGSICYGNAVEELSSLSEAAGFNEWVDIAAMKMLLTDKTNLTILVPSHQAIQNMDQDEKDFWMSKDNILTLTKHHILEGAYTVADLQHLSSLEGVATSLHGSFLSLSKRSGDLSIDGANIVAGDIATTNAIIHVVDKVLTPIRGVSGTLPKLLSRLEQMPDYSIFRGYIIQYNLASKIEAASTYTIFAPSNDAIENYLKTRHSVSLIRECCAGFFGTQCESCPGFSGNTCFGNGICLDGINGTGSCECEAGFEGVACNRCIKGKYGTNCDQEIKDDECNEINPCLQNNGGCDTNAECTHTGPNQNNGGCGENAYCNYTAQTERTCTCKPNYVGDGFTCRGSIFTELSRDFNTTRFNGYLMDAGVRDMATTGPFTVFAPSMEAFLTELKVNDWFSKGVMPQILRYHIVSCAGLLYNDLTSDKTVTTLQGDQLKITFTQESLKIVAAKNGYSLFYNIIESSGLISLINDPLHQPVTLFWPTDNVIRGLPKDQQDSLFKMSDKEKLLQYLKFHIVGSAKIFAYALPNSDSLKTLQGSDLTVTCGDADTNIGELFLGEKMCKIVQRQLEFDGGIAYGIDCVLTDPVLGGRCDTFITSQLPPAQEGQKVHVITVVPVMKDMHTQENARVTVVSMVLHVNSVCPEDMAWIASLVNVQHMDSVMKGFLDPVNVSVKLDGLDGSVRPNLVRLTVEITEDLCKKANGGCHKNAKCIQTDVKVNCTCQKGYRGDGYTCIAINSCTDGLNGGCDEHATCIMTGPDKRKCECQDNYIGDGMSCELKKLPVDRCLQDNGECHADANCADLHFQDATVGVFHVRSPKGQYKLTFSQANKTCADEGAEVATYTQLSYAQKASYHLCAAGWLADGRVAYPTAFSAPKCGGGVVGIIDYGPRINKSETWDVFCYRVKDENKALHPGVGTGIFFVILLVIGIVALVGYLFFRFKQGTIRFQHFKGNDDTDVTLDKAQSSSISNPNYEHSTTSPPDSSFDPFSVSDEQQLVKSSPPEEF
ncbi:hypothetical protein JD844_028519 [Phrynosoma platyrhinos]|uniref:Stabilin 2 n=1 Tax=Phrynosoma platyrhinos TaxID=52577 RepID=A0ABQ7SI11_PHRPL|nr:hypothetical protein JD844_028519 [Phrynosoma platyrhinos]